MQTRDAPQENVHAHLMEMISALLLELNALQTLVAEDHAESPADRQMLRVGLHEAEQQVRDILHRIRISDEVLFSAELQGVPLPEALSRLLEETAEQLTLSSRVTLSGVDDQSRPADHTLSVSIERLLYIIAREALDQVSYHNGARRLRLILNYGAEEVEMSIEDDGINLALFSESDINHPDEPLAMPFALPESTDEPVVFVQEGIWQELRHKLEHLGGTLTISSLSERGTRVTAHVPYISHTHNEPVPDLSTTQPARIISPSESISILVVDRQAVIRAALKRLLESYSGLHVIGEAGDGVQAVSETLELGPQVVLLDSQLSDNQSLEALRQIKQLNLNTRVLLFSAQEREEYLYEILRAGADGYILKDIAPDALAEAIRTVARGEMLIQPQIASRLLSRVGRGRIAALTTREQEVLRLLARGLRNKEIAARLFVSERTINFHLANIYQKLNVSGRTEALSKALEQGLV
ncbi:MAG TPA: LuxR C-terminal-related transcriptional regulator [Ktedonobacteraceae bacterium]|jgi:DNA-binding NarL/FixJ family response regulator